MAIFIYKAITADNRDINGKIEATTEATAINKLQEMGYFPVSTSRIESEPRGNGSFCLSDKEVIFFTQKLCVLMRARLTLDSALALIVKTSDSPKLKSFLENVAVSVHNGASLSDALSHYSGSFSSFYISTLRTGESAGAIELVLERLYKHLEHSQKTKKNIQAALLYPVILLSFACLTLLVLLVFVVPQFQSLFEDMGKALPLPTEIVFSIASGLKNYGLYAGLVCVLLVVMMKRAMKVDSVKRSFDTILLNTPIIRQLLTHHAVTNFSRTLATLLSNGVSLVTALDTASNSLPSLIFRESLLIVKNKVKDGMPLKDALRNFTTFPPVALQLIEVGEDSGELVDMLEQVSYIYEEELKDTTNRFLTLLEPLLIIVLGIIIAGIIISVLLAVLSLNDFAI